MSEKVYMLNPEYQKLAHLREEALRNSQLIRCALEQVELRNLETGDRP